MDQLLCILRKNSSYGLVQGGDSRLKFLQFPVQFDLTSDVNDLMQDVAFPLLRNALGVDLCLKGIVCIKSTILPLDQKRLMAFYVLVDIEQTVLQNSSENVDLIWHSLKTLQKKFDQLLISFHDFEQIRKIDKNDTTVNYATVDYKNLNLIWTEKQIAESVNEAQNKLRLSARFDSAAFELFKQAYIAFTFPEQSMSQDQFGKLMQTLKLHDAETNLHRYFRSFDQSKNNQLSFLDVVLGCAAMEMHTTHGNEPGEQRCRYIFRFYSQKPDSTMAFGEMVTMIDDIITLKMSNESKKTKDEYRASLVNHFTDSFTMNAFLQKVGSLQLRGTSVLFRSRICIYERLKEVFGTDGKEKHPPAPFVPAEPVQDGKMNGGSARLNKLKRLSQQRDELMDVSSDKDQHDPKPYIFSKHVLQLGPTGRFEEKVKNLTDAISTSSNMTKSSDASFDQSDFMAKQMFRALNYFRQPLRVGESVKSAFDWYKVDMSAIGEALIDLSTFLGPVLQREPRMLELDDPLYVLGDIHGNIGDMFEFESRLWPLGPAYSPAKILFLGDYVDRGAFGVEVVMYLFASKCLYPDRFFVLRGNHEIRSIQKAFTFHGECLKKFGDDLGGRVFESINLCFDSLPVCAVVNQKVFCVHGGIPPPNLCEIEGKSLTLKQVVNDMPVPLNLDESPLHLAWNLLWNDPIWQNSKASLDDNGFGLNVTRNTGYVFSSTALHNFLTKNNLSHVIRAHQVQMEGFQIRYSSKLLTVFSSSSYAQMENNAACVLLDRGKIKLIQLSRNTERVSYVLEEKN